MPVDRRGDRFLTRSARAVDEYGHIALCSHRDLLVDLLHGRGRPKERIKIPRLDGLCGQGKIDLLCKRFGKRLESIRQIKWLCQVLKDVLHLATRL